jgi:hypothetical protein
MTVKSEVIGQLFISSTMIENQKIYMDNNKWTNSYNIIEFKGGVLHEET